MSYWLIIFNKSDEEKEAKLVSGFWSKRKAKQQMKAKINRFKAEVLSVEKVYILFKNNQLS